MAESQKGYHVAQVSVEDLYDLTEARIEIEDRPFEVDRARRSQVGNQPCRRVAPPFENPAAAARRP